jgi:hypothetical protein
MHDTLSEIVNLRAVGAGAVPKPELPVGKAGGEDAAGAVHTGGTGGGHAGHGPGADPS